MKTKILLSVIWLALLPVKAISQHRGVADNSFFLEEAYNQEDRVVQHIISVTIPAHRVDQGTISFTEEVPLSGQKHQLALTIPYEVREFYEDGMGDLSIHYRYQLLPATDRFAMSPRLSVMYGSTIGSAGVYDAALGFELGIPVSAQIGNRLDLHLNASAACWPNADFDGVTFGVDCEPNYESETLFDLRAGAGLIWHVSRNLNSLLEVVYTAEDTRFLALPGFTSSVITSPGARAAINIGSLQVVPGFAVPIEFSDGGHIKVGYFFYLSLEHPY